MTPKSERLDDRNTAVQSRDEYEGFIGMPRADRLHFDTRRVLQQAAAAPDEAIGRELIVVPENP